MENEKYFSKLENIKETLQNLMSDVEELKSLAYSEKEKYLANNIFFAVDNALDISTVKTDWM